ncbi:hypothetical protein BJY01DRAFT_246687 [Aspergillus pseudoustus]|uniref:Hypervirulence associated protein TUDOR domain-containing protein n=1 Tax=Aspergillus pseudoustus TaxID=1810923 RepID=A0ABR4K654_9EURO
MPSKQNNYTDPELREEVKQEVQAGDKGGKPGQWSARKAQLTASEYKARGGDYTTSKDEKAPQQKNLDKWTGEEWQTKEGSGHAKQEDGTEKRYLPKKAWENMSEKEKEETEEKKVQGSKEGKQFVENAPAAKRKRGEVSKKEKGDGDKGKAKGKGNVKGKGKKEDKDKEGESEEVDQDEINEQDDEVNDDDQGDEDDENVDEEEEEEDDGEEDEIAKDNEDVEGQEQADDEPSTKESEAADTPEGEQPEQKRRKKD